MMKLATALLLGTMVIPALGCGNTARLEAIEKAKVKLELAEAELAEDVAWFDEYGDSPKSDDPQEAENYKVRREMMTASEEKVAAAKAELKKLVDAN